MPLFTSSTEKRLWIYTFLVLTTILSTLFLGSHLLQIIKNQNFIEASAMLALLLTGATILTTGLKSKLSTPEYIIWLGLAAVYTMFFVRLGNAERTHLMEYSVLTIFIYLALTERAKLKPPFLNPAILSFFATSIFGLFDEIIQIFIPSRVFDPIDVLFNCLAAFMAIASTLAVQWMRKK